MNIKCRIFYLGGKVIENCGASTSKGIMED
jgi:hypothetical protein